MSRLCRTCRYFRASLGHREIESFGECRRHAPRPETCREEWEMLARWPKVEELDWCGDWIGVDTQEANGEY